MLPAARATDMHVCPMQTPAVVPIPHVGGPLLPLPTTVLIGNMPAATLGADMCLRRPTRQCGERQRYRTGKQ